MHRHINDLRTARWLIRHRGTPQRTFILLFEGMGDAAVLLVGQG